MKCPLTVNPRSFHDHHTNSSPLPPVAAGHQLEQNLGGAGDQSNRLGVCDGFGQSGRRRGATCSPGGAFPPPPTATGCPSRPSRPPSIPFRQRVDGWRIVRRNAAGTARRVPRAVSVRTARTACLGRRGRAGEAARQPRRLFAGSPTTPSPCNPVPREGRSPRPAGGGGECCPSPSPAEHLLSNSVRPLSIGQRFRPGILCAEFDEWVAVTRPRPPVDEAERAAAVSSAVDTPPGTGLMPNHPPVTCPSSRPSPA